jgi:hypothetical protein
MENCIMEEMLIILLCVKPWPYTQVKPEQEDEKDKFLSPFEKDVKSLKECGSASRSCSERTFFTPYSQIARSTISKPEIEYLWNVFCSKTTEWSSFC